MNIIIKKIFKVPKDCLYKIIKLHAFLYNKSPQVGLIQNSLLYKKYFIILMNRKVKFI